MTIYKVTMDNIMFGKSEIYGIEFCKETPYGIMETLKKNGYYYMYNGGYGDVIYLNVNAKNYSRLYILEIKKRIANDVRNDLINRIL